MVSFINYNDLLENFFIIAGPCVIENKDTCLEIAETISLIRNKYQIPIIYKASFDKANRSSIESFRGPRMEKGVEILAEVKENFRLPICTDIHETHQVGFVSKVADMLQIPAFLCRQTDLVVEAAKTEKIINVKKGQFLAPWDVQNIAKKIQSTGNKRYFITERGTSFGYNRLVVDFTGMLYLIEKDIPLIFDVTHSLQMPGSGGTTTGGNRQYVEPMAYAASALGKGLKGMFFEIHPDPAKALSDAGNSYYSNQFENLVKQILEIRNLIANFKS